MSEALAALDLGTSRIRIGVWRAGRPLQVLASRPNQVDHGADGSATCSWRAIAVAVDASLADLGAWCGKHGITSLDLGLCGQVSSLLRWDADGDRPVADRFPIWMDRTCAPSLEALSDLLGDGRDLAWLGTRLPPATNWLATKILHHVRSGGETASRFLQVADAVFTSLTGTCQTHPGAQVSLVDQRRWAYAEDLLAALGCSEDRLPILAPAGHADLRPALRRRAGLPPTRVHVGLQDTYATVAGLLPEVGDGVLLAGTSEVVGVVGDAPALPAQALCARLEERRWLVYGSSTSGGATVAWLTQRLLGGGATPSRRLLRAAAAIAPGSDGVLCLPYPGGERAPLWDDQLTAAFTGLRSHHGDAHLLRAVFEGVAFARRRALDALERPLAGRLLVAGGGAANPLWNRIRAAVLGRPLEVLARGEAALVGVLAHLTAVTGGDPAGLRRSLRFTTIMPEPAWVTAYAAAYVRFLAAHGAPPRAEVQLA